MTSAREWRRDQPAVVVPRWVAARPPAAGGRSACGACLKAAGPVLLLFIIGGLVALLLNPFVTLLRRARVPRGIAVLIVMLGLVCVVGTIGLVLANPVSNQVSAFRDNVPTLVDDANATLADVQDWLDDNGDRRADLRGGLDGAAARSARTCPRAPARSSSSPRTRCARSSRRRWR